MTNTLALLIGSIAAYTAAMSLGALVVVLITFSVMIYDRGLKAATSGVGTVAELTDAARGRQFVAIVVREFLVMALLTVVMPFGLLVPNRVAVLWHTTLARVGLKRCRANPIVLVHGYTQSRANWVFFAPWLRLHGRFVVTVNLPTFKPIEEQAACLDRVVTRILAATGRSKVNLVGHSLGGVVSRYYAAHMGASRVGRVVSIGSPHQGSRAAYLAFHPSILQIAPGSDFLRALTSREGELQRAAGGEAGVDAAGDAGRSGVVAHLSIRSENDPLLIPAECAALPYPAANHVVRHVGHMGYFADTGVFRDVLRFFDEGR